jgi:predicted nucleic acid-binding protein
MPSSRPSTVCAAHPDEHRLHRHEELRDRLVKGRILDVAALVDIAGGRTWYGRTLVSQSVERLIPIGIPTTALAAAWAVLDAKQRMSLAVLTELGVTVVLNLDSAGAGVVGEILEQQARHGLVDVVAGQVAAAARDRGWPVVTDRGPQLRDLVPDLEIDSLP